MSSLRTGIVLIGVLALCVGGYARADIVNIDVEAGAAAGSNHVGDDGPLSSSGGTLWNSVVGGVGMVDLLTEFGDPTPFDVEYLSSGGNTTYTDAGINNLQDSGSFDPFQILELVQGETYSVAAYVGLNGGFNVQDANGSHGFFGFGDPGADGWSLPGVEGDGGDYFIVNGLVPFDVGGGVYGLEFQLDGDITGLQMNGVVPEPSTLLLIAFGLPLFRRSRR